MSVVGCVAAGLLVLFGTLAFVHVAVRVDEDCLEVRCGHIGRAAPPDPARRTSSAPSSRPRSPPATGAAGATAGAPRRARPWSSAAVRAWCSGSGTDATFTITVDDAEAAVRAIRGRLRPRKGTPAGA